VTSFATTVGLQWNAVTNTALAGYKVYYQADSSVQPFSSTGATQGNSPVDVHNQTSATIGGLDPSHAYYIAVTAYDTAGVESAYSNIAYVPEMVSPTVAITSPTNNATVSGTVSVTASGSDNVGVTKVEFYVNGVLKTTDTSTPYVYSWNTSALASGTYTLTAKAYDAAGNIGQSGSVSVSVVNDTTAPVVSVTSPVNNATVSGTVAITASASDNVGVSKVEFYENGALLFAGNVAPYTYNWNTASVANGSHTLTAKAYDNAGNFSQSSSVAVTVNNIVPDTTAPVVSTFSMPATATTLSASVSSLTATDAVGVTGYLITESSTAPAASTNGWTASAPATFTFSAAGSKTAYAWAKDAAGNVSSSRSANVSITLPAQTPALSISDALMALQTAAGVVQPTSAQMTRLDVAPYISGKSQPDGKIDVGDAIVILGKVTGKIAL
ncbi:MAG: Ig-like domain-containing protein, partial [Desulfobacteraceae bacterium]|nr:Ig-like domain-containing protein [Desulfobacteraceae bacterium]